MNPSNFPRTVTFINNCTESERREGSAIKPPREGKQASQEPARTPSPILQGFNIAAGIAGLIVLLAFIGFVIYMASLPRPVTLRPEHLHPRISYASEMILVAGAACAAMVIVLGAIIYLRAKEEEPAQISITSDTLIEKRNGVTTTAKWEGFRSIELNPSVIILHFDDVERVVIPRRLLGPETQAAEIVQMLQSCVPPAAAATS